MLPDGFLRACALRLDPGRLKQKPHTPTIIQRADGRSTECPSSVRADSHCEFPLLVRAEVPAHRVPRVGSGRAAFWHKAGSIGTPAFGFLVSVCRAPRQSRAGGILPFGLRDGALRIARARRIAWAVVPLRSQAPPPRAAAVIARSAASVEKQPFL